MHIFKLHFVEGQSYLLRNGLWTLGFSSAEQGLDASQKWKDWRTSGAYRYFICFWPLRAVPKRERGEHFPHGPNQEPVGPHFLGIHLPFTLRVAYFFSPLPITV